MVVKWAFQGWFHDHCVLLGGGWSGRGLPLTGQRPGIPWGAATVVERRAGR